MNHLSVGSKLSYGVGQIAEAIKGRGFDLLVFFYFTQVLGLSGSLAGAAVFIALLFDAATDPVVGYVSDHWRSPRGRRHPFMFAAILPLTISWVILFLPPEGFSELQLFAWLLFWAIVVRASMTLYYVPYLALGAELSDDYQERTSVVAWRSACSLVGAGVVFVVGIRVFLPETPGFENGMLNPGGYPHIAVFSAVVMGAAVLYCALATRRWVPDLPKAPDDGDRTGYFAELRAAFANPSFVSLFIGFSLFGVSIGAHQTLSGHMNVFFWGFETGRISLLVIPTIFGFLPGIFATRALHGRFDKKPTMIVSVLCSTVLINLPVALGLLGWIAWGEQALFWLIFVMTFLYAGAGGVAITTAGSMMADVAQEHRFVTGRSLQGILFAAISFSGKAASGFGHFFAGAGLDVISFPLKAAPSEVGAAALSGLGVLFLVAGIGSFLGILAIGAYRIDRSRWEETLAAT